jgi:hypothetical protein
MKNEQLSDSELRKCSAERAELVNVCETCPEAPYIQLQVPDEAKRVQQITFTITSHDQGEWVSIMLFLLLTSEPLGWADENNSNDPYASSYTWFAVYVRRRALRYNATIYQREVQRNIRGNGEYRTHIVHWNDHDDNGDTVAWLEGLRGGDIIQLVPRAEYPAWVNIIQHAKMELEYEPRGNELLRAQTLGIRSSGFVYQPLDLAKRDIRILNVHPGAFGDSIRTTLSHLSLSATEGQQFEALSYCWGEFTRRRIISLEYEGNEYEFPVTDSVEAAIRHLRSDNNTLSIWIDLICIDQTNFEERAHQVALMTDIYSLAIQVNIWLGAGTVSERTAFKVVRDIYNSTHKICSGGSGCLCATTKHSLSLEHLKELAQNTDSAHNLMEQINIHHAKAFGNAPPSYMTSYLIVISELFRNPWFRRVWVLQEVMNAQNAIVRAGSESMPWEELVHTDMLPNVFHAPHLLPFYKLPPIWTSLGRVCNPALFPAPDNSAIEAEERGLLDVFLQALNMDASDRRDKVFALLSFGRQTKTLQNIPQLIQPIYTRPAERVFADFTRWCILEISSLSILSMLHGQCGRAWEHLGGPDSNPAVVSQPSWAFGSEGRYEWSKITIAARFNFHAAGDSMLNLGPIRDPPDADPLKLHLSGVRLARIKAISQFPLLRQGSDTLLQVYTSIFDPTGHYENWKRGGRDIKERGELGSREMQFKIRQHLSEHWSYGPRPLVSVIRKRDIRAEEDAEDYELQQTNLALPCHGQCFFIATDGSLGLCPANAKVGDMIVVFHGGNVPFLLRNSDSNSDRTYELIGECYVDGRMNGEAMGAPSEMFILV